MAHNQISVSTIVLKLSHRIIFKPIYNLIIMRGGGYSHLFLLWYYTTNV